MSHIQSPEKGNPTLISARVSLLLLYVISNSHGKRDRGAIRSERDVRLEFCLFPHRNPKNSRVFDRDEEVEAGPETWLCTKGKEGKLNW